MCCPGETDTECLGRKWRGGTGAFSSNRRTVGELSLAGGLDNPPVFGWILNPFSSNPALHQGAQICANNFTEADLNSHIAVAGTLFGVREWSCSPFTSKPVLDTAQVNLPGCLFQCRLGLVYPSLWFSRYCSICMISVIQSVQKENMGC